MKKAHRIIAASVLGISLLAAGAPLSQADSLPGGAEGCGATTQPVPVVAKDQQVMYSGKCAFTAKRDGGYVANGSFKITITRMVKGKAVKIVLTDKTHDSYCITAIKAKDKVAVQALSGGLAVGNPFPAGTPSTNSAGDDHNACKK